jgi:hypothetical protein
MCSKSDFVQVTPWYTSHNVVSTILTQTLYPNIVQRANVLTDYGQFDYRSGVVRQHATAIIGRPSCRPCHQHHWSIPPFVSYQSINENWRGKSDPIRRRCIQDRLNQRAFRERHLTVRAKNDHDHRRDNALSTIQQE